MNDTDDRRERWESAIREQHNGLWPAEVSAIATTTRAMADAEQREAEEKHQDFLQHADQVNNDLMKEVQRYAKGEEMPVLWSVYNGMHKRALTAEAENARLRAELEQLRDYTAELEEQVIAMGGHQAAAEEHEAAIDRVRALHERREGDDGSTYCDLCSNHGDTTWPCTTIAALDGREAGQ